MATKSEYIFDEFWQLPHLLITSQKIQSNTLSNLSTDEQIVRN